MIPRLATCTVLIAGLAATVSAQTPAPGTYRIWLCVTECTPADSSRAIGSATIIIVEDSVALTDGARAALSEFRAIRRTNESSGPANVCVRVTQRERQVGTEELFFGIEPRVATRWTFTAGEGFSLRVYLSPDAGYTLRWTDPGALTRGEGWSFGWQSGTPSHRNAHFAAIQVGPPDLARCAAG